jgi:pyruvate, orthophosphate dikinase
MRLIEKGAASAIDSSDHGLVDQHLEQVEKLKQSAKALTAGIIDAVKSGNAQATAAFLGRPMAVPENTASETRQALSLLSDALKGLGVEGTLATQFATALETLVGAGAVAHQEAANSPRPLVFGFGGASDGADLPADRKKLLGGKGAELLEMSSLGMPIPPGFTLTTEACAAYLQTKKWPDGLEEQVELGLRQLEERTGKKFGDPTNPLLVSVRSGAAVSMPGMMDTILNLGLNDEVCRGLAQATGNERFAYDAYRRFISMFANVAMGVPYEHFEAALKAIKKEKGVTQDVELGAAELKELVARYQQIYREQTGAEFPSEAKEQLRLAVGAVFESWNNDRAIKYREINKIEGLLGTGVNVQSMVFGNMGDGSGTGVCFTRNPGTGGRELFGEFLTNAQGEDVVAGIRTPMPITRMAEMFPEAYEQLLALCSKLEGHYRNMQDIEFTVENGKLFILQTRNGKRNGEAAVKIAVDLVREGVTDPRTAILKMVDAEHVAQMLRPRFAETEGTKPVKLTAGIAASPGAAVGQAVFTVEDAIALSKSGIPVILVRNDTSPEDVGGMDAAQGVLTRTGGKTSHAAVVARGRARLGQAVCHRLRRPRRRREGEAVRHRRRHCRRARRLDLVERLDR